MPAEEAIAVRLAAALATAVQDPAGNLDRQGLDWTPIGRSRPTRLERVSQGPGPRCLFVNGQACLCIWTDGVSDLPKPLASSISFCLEHRRLFPEALLLLVASPATYGVHCRILFPITESHKIDCMPRTS